MATTQSLSWKLVGAYVLDWVLILGMAAIGGGISKLSPFKRAFSLTELRISYPMRDSAVSTGLLVILSLLVPIIVIVAVVMLLFPRLSSFSQLKSGRFWRRKIWELNAGIMGLGVSYALTLVLVQATKNLFGKPRPDMLSRCQPDMSKLSSYVLEGFAQDIAQTWAIVDVRICTNTDKSVLDDGFRSFFSGHAAHSFSGLLYLSLWLAVKLNVTFPYVQPYTAHDLAVASFKDREALPTYNPALDTDEERDPSAKAMSTHPTNIYRKAGAAPPIFGLIIFWIPIILAVYIASTRYQEYKHEGVDLFTGTLVGCGSAIIGFRFYHSSLTKGQAWTWAPRTVDNAFYVWASTSSVRQDESVPRQRGARSDVNGGEAQHKPLRQSDERHSDEVAMGSFDHTRPQGSGDQLMAGQSRAQ